MEKPVLLMAETSMTNAFCRLLTLMMVSETRSAGVASSRELAEAGAFAMRLFSPSCTTMMYFKPGSMVSVLTKE